MMVPVFPAKVIRDTNRDSLNPQYQHTKLLQLINNMVDSLLMVVPALKVRMVDTAFNHLHNIHRVTLKLLQVMEVLNNMGLRLVRHTSRVNL